jgi:hypothetical protein
VTNTTGYNNTGIGTYALYENLTGTDNTAVGYEAMVGNSSSKLTGQYNTGIGDSALYAIQGVGANNTTLGYKSGYAVTTGTDNTLVGYEAGLGVTGNGNIIIGEDTNSAVTTGGNNIVIGQNTSLLTNTSSNQLDIGNLIYATGLGSGSTLSTGSVGIGTSSPSAMLDIGNKGTTLGTLRLESSTSSSYVQLQPSTTLGSWTLTLPASAGTNTYVLQTDGSGNTSWVAPGTGVTLGLGTAATATNPQRPGQAGTGFYSDTSNEVEVAIGGANLVTWTASAENLTGTITQGSYSIGYQINGSNAVWQDAANYNLAVGSTAFPTTVSRGVGAPLGQSDTAVGYQALNANTTGYYNTAVGYTTLAVNTTGIQNTAVGMEALANSTTG